MTSPHPTSAALDTAELRKAELGAAVIAEIRWGVENGVLLPGYIVKRILDALDAARAEIDGDRASIMQAQDREREKDATIAQLRADRSVALRMIATACESGLRRAAEIVGYLLEADEISEFAIREAQHTILAEIGEKK